MGFPDRNLCHTHDVHCVQFILCFTISAPLGDLDLALFGSYDSLECPMPASAYQEDVKALDSH